MEVSIIVPCHNEADRLDIAYWNALLSSGVNLLFVDDCSTDLTHLKLEELKRWPTVTTMRLNQNVGKSNAIRHGILELIRNSNLSDGDLVGFLDADSAFSVEDILDLIALQKLLKLDTSGFDALWSSRVMLSGRRIERKLFRHFISRLLITWFGIFDRDLPYDTQAGLKLFKYNQIFDEIVSEPFSTRWFMDLEIYSRFFQISGRKMKIWEQPVKSWRDVAGSKIKIRKFLSLSREILYITRILLR